MSDPFICPVHGSRHIARLPRGWSCTASVTAYVTDLNPRAWINSRDDGAELQRRHARRAVPLPHECELYDVYCYQTRVRLMPTEPAVVRALFGT
jgi:hypothetical protein